MKNDIEIGTNLTGIGTSPSRSKDMIAAALLAAPTTPADPQTAEDVRIAYAHEAGPIGTMPPPTTLRGLSGAAMRMLKGEKPNVLLDKLGERLAFERTGARLYELLMIKAEASPPAEGGPSIADIQRIHDDELAHFGLVARVIEGLGADSTVETPAADIVAVASSGLLQIVGDPRTSLSQSLQAMLIAELADNDGWQLLIELASDLGHDSVADELRHALTIEKQHLEDVRAWVSDLARIEAGA